MSMLKAVWQAIVRLFVGKTNDARGLVEPVLATKAPEIPAYKAPIPEEKTKGKKPRAQRAKELISMGSLLESLDETFAAMRLPFGKLSWIPRSKVVGLRKMGVHVVHPAYNDTRLMSSTTVPANRILPAMLCVSFGWSRRDNSLGAYPAVLFATKENKLPAGVSSCAGQHYLFGAGFKLGIASENDTNKALYWLAGYMTVRADGSLYMHQELMPRQHTIRVSNPSSRRAGGKTITYTTKAWGKASMAQLYDEAAGSEGERICISEFAVAMNWWIAREENWSVAVKKCGERITFAIPKELTSQFFRDRIKVKNENGVTKRIIHYVSAHERETSEGKTTVKEHIRGLAEFDWKGYDCRVTAPKFNGSLSTNFTIAARAFDEDEELPKKGWIDMPEVGSILSDLEEGRRASA